MEHISVMGTKWLMSIAMICSASVANAQEYTSKMQVEEPKASRNFVNLRIGSTSANRNSHPEMCLEAAPMSFFSVEMCGTGTGIFHTDPAPALMHVRTKIRAVQVDFEDWFLTIFGGVGFAELQVGEDAPGFIFNGVGPQGVETAGPEVSAHVRALIPVFGGVDLMTELSLSGAYLPYAPDLVTSLDPFQPAFSFTIGAGF